MSDSARKRVLADWVVKTKKQIVKLYAVVKWSRDAQTIQKCMVNDFLSSYAAHPKFLQNIIAFLLAQNQQFEHVVNSLKNAKELLDPARYEVKSENAQRLI